GWFLTAGVTGRTGRGQHGGASFENPGAGSPRKKHIQRVGEAVHRISDKREIRYLAFEEREQLSRELSQSLSRILDDSGSGGTGRAQPDDEGDIFCAGPNPAFLPRPHDERRQFHTLADIERTNSLRGIELMPGNSQQVDAQLRGAD